MGSGSHIGELERHAATLQRLWYDGLRWGWDHVPPVSIESKSGILHRRKSCSKIYALSFSITLPFWQDKRTKIRPELTFTLTHTMPLWQPAPRDQGEPGWARVSDGWVQGERLMARVHAHPRSIGPKMDSLLYAILGCIPRSRFVSPLWIRQTDT